MNPLHASAPTAATRSIAARHADPHQRGRARCAYAVFAVVVAASLFALPSQTWSQTAGGSLDVPQTRLAPIGAPVGPPPSTGTTGGTLGTYGAAGPNPYAAGGQQPLSGMAYGGTSAFDPYAGAPASGFVSPLSSSTAGGSLLGAPVTSAPPGGIFAPTPPPASFGAPVYGGLASQPPPVLNAGSIFGGGVPPGGMTTLDPSAAYAAPPAYSYPSSAYPSGSPSSLFPSGFLGPTSSYSPTFDPYRLIQRGRFRHTYIYDGDGNNDLSINDTDVALAFAIPSFLFSTQPLYIAPSFSLHLWDGPKSITGADMPRSAYSGFLDFAWMSDPNRMAGAELGVSLGVFSEFGVYTGDSFRVRGKGLGTFRLTPATTFKLGVYYYDRVDIKILPAFGWFCRPNPYTRVDLFFPQPKYARYISTVGTQDVWWYVAGEYGGGSWTIERDGGGEDQVDINDFRLLLGFEWGESERMRAGLRTWSFEFGYIGGRELVYRHNPADSIELGDTWMVRLGIGY